MNDKQPGNPLHNITLEMILLQLVVDYGWSELGRIIDIKCFKHEPSIQSSLKFLRKSPWARTRVEELYISKKLGRAKEVDLEKQIRLADCVSVRS